MPRKDPTPATLKALFAKSGNLCAFSKCTNRLVDDLNIFVGEVAHINSVSKKDARYDPSKTDDDLRHYDNLILLCHPHHKRVDTREDLYSADTLRTMKAEHEAGIFQTDFVVDDSVLASADFQIVQESWVPFLDPAIELLYSTLQEGHISQGKMNRVSGMVASITDAQLFVIYTRLFQTLATIDQINLYREQQSWLVERMTYAKSQVESHGGSLAPLEFREAFSEFTKRRIAVLSSRLEAYE